jgi:hypothetical protein
MSKKSMKNVDMMSLERGSAVDQVEHLLDMIMEVSCNTNGCMAKMKIIRAVEDALQVMTEAYIPASAATASRRTPAPPSAGSSGRSAGPQPDNREGAGGAILWPLLASMPWPASSTAPRVAASP